MPVVTDLTVRQRVGVRHERAEFVRRIEPFPILQARAKGDDRVQRAAGFDELQIQIAAHADKGRTVHGHAVDGHLVVVLELEDDDAMRRAVADIDNAGKRGEHGDLAEGQLHHRARGMEIREIQGHAARIGDELDRPEGVDVGKLDDRKRRRRRKVLELHLEGDRRLNRRIRSSASNALVNFVLTGVAGGCDLGCLRHMAARSMPNGGRKRPGIRGGRWAPVGDVLQIPYSCSYGMLFVLRQRKTSWCCATR